MLATFENIDYDQTSFNKLPPPRHPPYISDRQIFYHLTGPPTHLTTLRDDQTGRPVKSPRRLEHICANFLVTEITFSSLDNLPSPLYPTLLTEAILFREPRPISALVSTWPEEVLNVIDHVPLEDDLFDDYLTSKFEGHDDVTLLDCFVLGLLKLKPSSRLKTIDFRGFSKDRRLCKELLRLPVLWLAPESRRTDSLHAHMSKLIEISQEKVNCFLNRISAIYTNLDCEFKHQVPIDSVTIAADLQINIDDVPIGLSLQHLSPFVFKASKVWIKPLPDVHFPINHLPSVLDAQHVTQFEVEDVTMNYDVCKLYLLYETLNQLPNLTSLSLPGCLDVSRVEFVAEELARHLYKLPNLTRLNLSYCDLKGNLHHLLENLQGPLLCLTLKDCRLEASDILALLSWRWLRRLRDLNLSCNNLQRLEEISILRHCMSSHHLRLLALQSYIPPLRADMLWILESLIQLPYLERAIIFPEAYAFPGDVEAERRDNKQRTLHYCVELMKRNGRPELRID